MLHHEPSRLSKEGNAGGSRSLALDVKFGDHNRITFKPDIGDEHDVAVIGPNLHLDHVAVLFHQTDQHHGAASCASLDSSEGGENLGPRTIEPSS
jgi:hypothetical protein